MESGTNPEVAAARAQGFVGQRELAIALGLSDRRVGALLEGLGLKIGKEATPFAHSIAACTPPLHGRSGHEEYTFHLWDPLVVLPRLHAVAPPR
ncbi:hypothetical protein [Microbacterium lacticum]|uniref:hypothetical protein n=1 Tax=Microbacterium lacticum TaxID=33885 RepID=UPI001F58A901|nr:hypothetical protein [Microbacterium lacticum]